MATIGDVVLIHLGEKPSFFARIDSIEPDVKRDWFQVHILILAIPLTTVTWILREEYINGTPFTMEGNPIRIEAVKPFAPNLVQSEKRMDRPQAGSAAKAGKVIPFVKEKKDESKGP